MVGVGTIVLLSGLVLGEVPPLATEELRRESEVVVTGVVKSIRVDDKRTGELVRRYYTFDVGVLQVEKGTLADSETGRGMDHAVRVRGWRLLKAPMGFAGPGGHYYVEAGGRLCYISEVGVNNEVRLYLGRLREDGVRRIVSPNGFMVIVD